VAIISRERNGAANAMVDGIAIRQRQRSNPRLNNIS